MSWLWFPLVRVRIRCCSWLETEERGCCKSKQWACAWLKRSGAGSHLRHWRNVSSYREVTCTAIILPGSPDCHTYWRVLISAETLVNKMHSSCTHVYTSRTQMHKTACFIFRNIERINMRMKCGIWGSTACCVLRLCSVTCTSFMSFHLLPLKMLLMCY